MALYATHGEEDKMFKIGFGLVFIFRLVKNSYLIQKKGAGSTKMQSLASLHGLTYDNKIIVY